MLAWATRQKKLHWHFNILTSFLLVLTCHCFSSMEDRKIGKLLFSAQFSSCPPPALPSSLQKHPEQKKAGEMGGRGDGERGSYFLSPFLSPRLLPFLLIADSRAPFSPSPRPPSRDGDENSRPFFTHPPPPPLGVGREHMECPSTSTRWYTSKCLSAPAQTTILLRVLGPPSRSTPSFRPIPTTFSAAASTFFIFSNRLAPPLFSSRSIHRKTEIYRHL